MQTQILNILAFLTNIFSKSQSFFTVVTWTAQAPTLVFNKAYVGKRNVAELASETSRMPVVVHRLDNSSNNKLL